MNIVQVLASPDFPIRIFMAVISFVWGACIGSFLNVCIYRIPRELSVVTPRSYCPGCRKPIPWYLNIPLISYLMLAGKCRRCGIRISPRYFLVELLVAILFLLVWFSFDQPGYLAPLHLNALLSWKLVPVYWLIVLGLVLGTFVDIEHLIIPDRVTIGGIICGLILSMVVPELHGETLWWKALLKSGIGFAAGFGVLWAIAIVDEFLFKKEAMGFGDVKLLGAIGAFLGWQSVVFVLLISSLAGSLVGIALVSAGRREMQGRIPYGPFIALAAIVWLLWGPPLWSLYIMMLTPPISPLATSY